MVIRATQTAEGWNLRYVFADERSSESQGTLAGRDGEDYMIPLSSPKGFKGQLRLAVTRVAVAAELAEAAIGAGR